MIKISTRGQYALMTMEVLADQPDDSYVPMKKISHKQNLSVKYLEQILIQLSKAGLVEGMRGNNGGYKLKKSPEKYTAGEILRAMEGDLNPKGTKFAGGYSPKLLEGSKLKYSPPVIIILAEPVL